MKTSFIVWVEENMMPIYEKQFKEKHMMPEAWRRWVREYYMDKHPYI